jgi:hypothetical protein
LYSPFVSFFHPRSFISIDVPPRRRRAPDLPRRSAIRELSGAKRTLIKMLQPRILPEIASDGATAALFARSYATPLGKVNII